MDIFILKGPRYLQPDNKIREKQITTAAINFFNMYGSIYISNAVPIGIVIQAPITKGRTMRQRVKVKFERIRGMAIAASKIITMATAGNGPKMMAKSGVIKRELPVPVKPRTVPPKAVINAAYMISAVNTPEL